MYGDMEHDSEEGLRRFLPLIGVLSFVFVSTAIISFARGQYVFMEVGKVLMAMFFLTFGGFKVYNLEGFKEAFRSYDILAKKSDVYASVYPFLEVGLGALYLSLLFYGSLVLELLTYTATVLLMAVGGAGVLHALFQGRDLQCACLGNVFNVPMTKVTLAEDFFMAAMAGLMLILTV